MLRVVSATTRIPAKRNRYKTASKCGEPIFRMETTLYTEPVIRVTSSYDLTFDIIENFGAAHAMGES